jgi:hypothetical protein
LLFIYRFFIYFFWAYPRAKGAGSRVAGFQYGSVPLPHRAPSARAPTPAYARALRARAARKILQKIIKKSLSIYY